MDSENGIIRKQGNYMYTKYQHNKIDILGQKVIKIMKTKSFPHLSSRERVGKRETTKVLEVFFSKLFIINFVSKHAVRKCVLDTLE